MRWVVVSHEAELVSRRSLAQRLNVSLQTVALWETKRPPKGIILFRLAKLAEDHQHTDLAKSFTDAVDNETRREREEMQLEYWRWKNIFSGLQEIQAEALELYDVAPAASARITRILRLSMRVQELAVAAQGWSWRNQR